MPITETKRIEFKDLSEDTNMGIIPFSGSYGNFYVSVRGSSRANSGYLHSDGFVWSQTRNTNGNYTGFFDTREDAQKAIELHKKLKETERIRGLAEIEFDEPDFVEHYDGSKEWYVGTSKRISFRGGMRWVYLQKDGSVEPNTNNGVFKSRLEAWEILQAYRELFADYSWKFIKPYDRIKDTRDDTMYTYSYTPNHNGRVFARRDDNGYMYTLDLTSKNYHIVKTYKGVEYTLVDVDTAQYQFETNKELPIYSEYMDEEIGMFHRINSLAPKQWSNVRFFTIKIDTEKELEKKRLYMHHDFINSLEMSLNDAEYHGDNIYYINGASNTFNSSKDNPIKKESNGAIMCRGNKLRLGRVLAQIKPDWDSTAIERAVSHYKAQYEVDTSKVEVTDDIAEVYQMNYCGGSCMSEKPSSYFDIYNDVGSSICYIRFEGDLVARALIHKVIGLDTDKEYTVVDRIFFEKEIFKLTIKQWIEEQGYSRMSRIDEHVRTIEPINDSYENVPYIDNLKYATYFGNEMYLTNDGDRSYEDLLQETEGGSSDGVIAHGEDDVYCEDSGNYVNRDEAYYCEGNGCYYEDTDELAYISGDGYYHQDDSRIAYDECESEYNWKSNLHYCESEEIYTSSDSYVYVDTGDYAGSYEPEDDVFFCDDVSERTTRDECRYIEDAGEYWYHYEDNAYEHNDGKWYSYAEEDEDETEEVA